MTAIDVRFQFEQAVQAFESVDVDCKIAVLWQTYNTLGQAFAAIAPVALFSQAVQQMLSQIQQVDRDDQAAILRDILAGADTRFTQAYRGLNINMKLAFWHRLFNLLPANRLPLTSCQDGSATTPALLVRLDAKGLHFLRRAVG